MKQKLVSIIIRTCGRPDVLRLALMSVEKQTYKNIEIVLIEDGKESAKKMLETEFSHMNIVYMATNTKAGRSAVGNLGLQIAKGDYFNFLDDDDILYPNHVEELVKCLSGNTCGAAYSIAEESQIKIISEKPYKIHEKRIIIRYKQPYNKLLLMAFNYIPIQSIMFKRELFDKLGGFDETLEYLEDWDLWVRYSTQYDFVFSPVITSKYYVPYRSKKKMKRNRELEFALEPIKKKFSCYNMITDVKHINEDLDYILNVYNKKGILYYLKMIRNFILYREV